MIVTNCSLFFKSQNQQMKKVTLLRFSFLLTAFLLLSHLGFAQQRKIIGVVQDSKENSALDGATVSLKGEKFSTITEANGKFEIIAPAGQVSLIVSFVGYETKTVIIKEKQTNVLITLNSSTNALNDVVIVGYGTQKKSDLINQQH
jgi:hypothetical protein